MSGFDFSRSLSDFIVISKSPVPKCPIFRTSRENPFSSLIESGSTFRNNKSSFCGTINKELTLKDREWTCGICSTVLDRDVNAAINIKSFALKNHLSGEHTLKNQGKLPTLVGALTLEAQPIAFGVGG